MRITWFSLVQKLNSMTTFCLLFMLSETFYFPKAIASQPPHSFQWGHCTSGSEEKDTGSSRKESFAVTQQHTVLANLWHASSYNWKTTLKCGHDRWKCHVKMSGKKIPIIFLYSIPCMGEKSITLYQARQKKMFLNEKKYIYLYLFFVFRKQITRKLLTLPQGFHNYYRCTNCALCTVQNTVFTCFWYFTS